MKGVLDGEYAIDVVIATDIIEHVSGPIQLVSESFRFGFSEKTAYSL
ncbi:MAG: hypothetical protein MRJ65_07145 [Candidatus Brocadiaceae bacterium]|nr:hypothetical protein [Candidatus Brocadiaceae bacterium]